MKKLEKSYQDGDIKKKELVSIVGRQQGKEECWVLNKEIHINSKGVQVEPSESPYFWNNDLNSLAAEVVSLTKRKSFVRALLVAVKKSYGSNTSAVLLTFGPEIISFHYDVLNNKSFSVPATILTGPVNVGKSTASRVALSLTGSRYSFFTSATDAKIKTVTSKMTLGIVLDDPKDAQQIAEKVIHHFDRGKSCSQNRTCIPHCTFIASVNSDFLTKFCGLHPKYACILINK